MQNLESPRTLLLYIYIYIYIYMEGAGDLVLFFFHRGLLILPNIEIG